MMIFTPDAAPEGGGPISATIKEKDHSQAYEKRSPSGEGRSAHQPDIRIREVQVIDADGSNKGVLAVFDAIKLAEDQGLDLVEVSPNATPPVCKIMDYGRFRFAEQKKAAEARKKQKTIEIKEIKLRPAIDDHDYGVKMKAMKGFFEEGNKVKITLRFRGREMAHQDIGMRVLDRVKVDTADIAKVENEPSFEGRQVVMVLAPK